MHPTRPSPLTELHIVPTSRVDDLVSLNSASRALTNLPARATSFVGRAAEMAELRRTLDTARILTLTGAGGVGKTRLAIQTAASVVGQYPDGVWLVQLAPLANPAAVIQQVALTLSVREQHGRSLPQTLIEFLGERRILLVLDNCEHLIGACADLVEALAEACPALTILATSREPLGVDGEVNWRVPSLALPDSIWSSSLERIAGGEAVQLFVDRAAAAVPAFRLTEENAAPVAKICLQLDGIPLAIELAAARTSVLTPEQIAARLGDVFHLLGAGRRTALPRHQTLRATVDWSFALLSEAERLLFIRLSVFAGGWMLEAAEAICAGAGVDTAAVLDLLARLVDKSLVQADDRGSAVRYRLLEPVRQYAAEKLAESGEEPLLRDRHLEWYVRFAVDADLELRGPNLGAALDHVEAEYDNLRSALDWSVGKPDTGDAELELCAALLWFWYQRDRLPEGRERIERALRRTSTPSVARMHALASAGWIAHFDRDQITARFWLEESLALARRFQDGRAAAWALHLLARTHYFDGDAAAATALGNESLAAARAAGDRWVEGWATHVLALAAYVAGDYAQAQRWFEESLAIRQPIGHKLGIQIVHILLGYLAHRQGDHRRAAELQASVLRVGSDERLTNNMDHALVGLAALAVECAQPERAARLAGAASRRSEDVGVLPIPIAQALLAESLARARQQLGAAAYDAAWTDGMAISEDEVVAEGFAVAASFEEASSSANRRGDAALGEGASTASPQPTLHRRPLTGRETEVLRLVVQGRTTREIAAALVVSEPTIERHLTHIYEKVGARRRADAIAYAITHGLV
jgi:non-specific serine/threonine protein kinase